MKPYFVDIGRHVGSQWVDLDRIISITDIFETPPRMLKYMTAAIFHVQCENLTAPLTFSLFSEGTSEIEAFVDPIKLQNFKDQHQALIAAWQARATES